MRSHPTSLTPAFTLIEVIVSVIIISGVVLSIYEISSRSTDTAAYLSQRHKYSLSDSIFMTDTVQRYHKDDKSAYDLLYDEFKIKESKSRDILKKRTREIFIQEPVVLFSFDEGPTATQNNILLRGAYASGYYRFKIDGY